MSVQRFWPAVVAVLAFSLAACSTGSKDAADPRPENTSSSPAPSTAVHSGDARHRLTAPERALATRVARRQQAGVTGTFIGATAFATQGTPFDRGSSCDVTRRNVDVRLVWKADANFVHGGLPGGPPDGPRKDLLITIDAGTGHVCETGAGYRNVGAAPYETLLYGTWPDPADG